MEAGTWQQSRPNLSTARRAMSRTSRGWQQRLHRLRIPAGTLLWVTGSRSEREPSPRTRVPNKCPSSDCHRAVKLHSFPWSCALWLVLQYKARELKMLTKDCTNTRCEINRNSHRIHRWRNWKHWLYQEAVQPLDSCSVHSNRYHCYRNFSNMSLSELAGALADFSP